MSVITLAYPPPRLERGEREPDEELRCSWCGAVCYTPATGIGHDLVACHVCARARGWIRD